MKWLKKGLIFSPQNYSLFNNCIDFAQAPQTLVFDNFIRIYFSSRQLEKNGKYLSHVLYVDFTRDFSSIINISNHEVISLGNLGCYDEHGIFPFNVLRQGNNIFGFIGGWNRRISVLIDGAIGLSISNDQGKTFKRIGDGPILAPTLNEPFLIADPFVKFYEDIYHMWYIYGSKWIDGDKIHQPERIYKIAHATSHDALKWERTGNFIIPDILKEEECQALPTVFKIDNIYHMYFCYRFALDFRNNIDRGYKLGYAYSKDLKTWTRDDKLGGLTLSENGWDSEMICYPHVFNIDNKTFMLYNGNLFGKFGFGLAELIK